MFLKLLVAQLPYQDPTKPADTGQFLAQSAQFTMVERIEELAKVNADLLAAQRAASATALVGRQVSYTRSDGTLATGTVTAARLESSGPVLEVGGQSVPLSSVTAVTAAPATTPTTDTSSS
jgi:flagellar basal-body rod modification protein FlgD